MKRIIGLTLAVSMILCLFGCGAESAAKQAVSGMMDAFKALDFETAGQYIDLDQVKIGDGTSASNETGKQMLTALFDKLDYEIVSSEVIDDNTVKVSTKITAVDMTTVIREYAAAALSYAFSYAFSEEQPSAEEKEQKNTEFFTDAVKNNAEKKVTNQVDITVKNEDGVWRVQADDAFVNALLGGIQDAVNELEESFSGVGEETEEE